MKLKFRKKHKHRLSKFDMFAGRYMEHDYNDEGQYHPSQLYPSSILNGRIKNITLSKYHLVKKFNEQKKEINGYTNTKNTKLIKQLIKIHYFITLVKKTYYLVKALKKAKKALKIWMRQIIQNEIYFFKKAIKIAKTKNQLILVYLKYKRLIRKYKKIYIHYLKNIIKRYAKKTRRIKNQWKTVLTRGFTKGFKQKNNVIPFIFYMRKILFKKIRTGTLKQMKYFKKIIKKFTKRTKVTKELDLNYLINTKDKEISSNSVQLNTSTLIPFILLKYVYHMKKKSRPSLIGKISKQYYQQLISLARLKKRTTHKIRKYKRNKIHFKKLITFYSIICGKKKFVQRKSYKKRKLTPYISRMAQQTLVKIPLHLIKRKIDTDLAIDKTISTWLISMKNWKRFKLFKHLKKLKRIKRKKVKTILQKYKYKNKRKRNYIRYKVRQMIYQLIDKTEKYKHRKIRIMKRLKQKVNNRAIQILKNKKNIRELGNYILHLFRLKKKKKIKKGKKKWWERKMMKKRVKRKIRRIAYRTPYMLSCQFYRDYTGNWIELYKKRNMFNKMTKNKSTDKLATKVASRRQKRILRKNYRVLPNDRYTMLVKHKEILKTLSHLFTPKM